MTKSPMTFEEYERAPDLGSKSQVSGAIEAAFNAGRNVGLEEAANVCDELSTRSWEYSLGYASKLIRDQQQDTAADRRTDRMDTCFDG